MEKEMVNIVTPIMREADRQAEALLDCDRAGQPAAAAEYRDWLLNHHDEVGPWALFQAVWSDRGSMSDATFQSWLQEILEKDAPQPWDKDVKFRVRLLQSRPA